MRIIVNGQQAFGSAVLEALLDRDEDVVGVYTAPDKEGRKPDPLKELAQSRGIPVFQPPSFKTPEVIDEVKSLKPDLCVMAFVTLFVPEDVLYIPTHGTIQYHPSLLPQHRGPSAINWAIIQGRKRTGLSIFWPDQGLDTGPILLQKEVEITADDTLGSVYFDKLFQLGVDAMIEGVDLVRDGKAEKTVQDETQATYESWCNREAAEIDWTKPIGDVYNLIRGCNPQPGAWTTCGGKMVQIFDAAIHTGGGGTPGQVSGMTSEGFTVAVAGGDIEVKRVRPEGGDKTGAADFAAASGLKEGTQLG